MMPAVGKSTDEQAAEARSWPVWEHEAGKFDYEYSDKEEFYVVEGNAKVHCDEGTAEFSAGDYVVMPKGLKCTWEINKKIVKHYRFG